MSEYWQYFEQTEVANFVYYTYQYEIDATRSFCQLIHHCNSGSLGVNTEEEMVAPAPWIAVVWFCHNWSLIVLSEDYLFHFLIPDSSCLLINWIQSLVTSTFPLDGGLRLHAEMLI